MADYDIIDGEDGSVIGTVQLEDTEVVQFIESAEALGFHVEPREND